MRSVTVGIDESNHGKFPEIYVAFFSENLEDGIKLKATKRKLRRKNEVIDESTEIGSFVYIVIQQEHQDAIDKTHPVQLKIRVLHELVTHCMNLEGTVIKQIIIDGNLRRGERKYFDEILPDLEPKLIAEPKADQRYIVVNQADHVASCLYRLYRDSKSEELKKFEESLIKLRLNRY